MSSIVEVHDGVRLADWRRRVAELYAGWREQSADDPERATLEFRAARDRLFIGHPQSPLPGVARPTYGGVPYFGYDPAYRLTVTVEPIEVPAGSGASAPISLPASGAESLAFRRLGQVVLDGPLAGARLTVFWTEGYAGGLFLPFRDATSGRETYPAGRYLLDTIKGADLGGDAARGELLLDFNMAYHPSCAYDPRWVCPLAPPENRLAVAVTVGERLA